MFENETDMVVQELSVSNEFAHTFKTPIAIVDMQVYHNNI